ncbi:uncharacterized protein MONBRDRAFT_13096 [Monosiga brevicollis MX1]|uniref:Uncharacterized protein n=1 Tax=Monosiga brevicollis TaxID=81824 RepID=A9VEA3_MONBE|nr:uncharacterized protein MONBRDRAFT_13096 [Monosiga brevicollis MX1]EDQ84137.1 predicted protein [Monosiga brevicollis MX1]|eukprot:XP_001751050.1 hypothetical protein [Monosiga brevicollis MX1]
MAKCALDLQQAYLASREWGVSTVLTMRGRDKLRRLSDTTFAITVVSMMGFGLHELINVKPTDKCPLCSSKTPQPRLTREHLLTCRPIKRHNALRDEMGRLLRYATLSHVWVEKSGYNANGQSCRIDLHCRNPFPGGALGPALPDLGIDVTVRTAQPPTTSQACIKVGAALRRAEKEKRDYYTGFNHGKTLIVPAAMTTTGEELPVARCLQQDLALGIQHVGSDGRSGIAEKNILLTLNVFARCIVCFILTDFAKWG